MLFSVIVPMFNIGAFADECIRSIEAQTFRDFELILVDDGSTDQTSGIIDRWAEDNDNIRVIHKKNGGLTSARKAGAAVASGEYIVCVDGDDWIEPDYLADFAAAIMRNRPDLVAAGFCKAYPDGRKEARYAFIEGLTGLLEREDIERRVLSRLFLVHPTIWAKTIRRELYLESQMRVDDRISLGEDGCIVFPILPKTERIEILGSHPYCYRFNQESLTKSRKKKIPWESCKLRVRLLENSLPLDRFGLRRQLSQYAVRASMNVLLTNFRNAPYREVIRAARQELNDPMLKKYLAKPCWKGGRKDKAAWFLLRFRLFPLIKLYSTIV